jgi:hypothetical protein
MNAPAYAIYAGEKLWTIMPAGYLLTLHAETFKAFPPRQAPPDFDAGAIIARAVKAAANAV